MVMTSDQIAQQSMAFQQQVMMQNQYSGMVSQNAGSAPTGERMMGSVANRGMGIGSAVLGGGMAIAGLDPMSLAMKAGMGGFASGGMMGAAGAAAGAFLPAYAAFSAAQYAGGKIMGGMGQQQELNATLRQNYQFMGQTGRGFQQSEMGGIGEMMRGMTATRGPGGEFATMDELTRMAGNMGRMGLSQGVRSAKEFSDKFKEMVTTVKEIATTFSTSLEQAQQVMVGMRQSGIFNNQGKVAAQIREISQAGGMATSEVTGMMTVGSQISRMIGGRGKAGAMGGMKAIAQVGIAQQAGLISEEQLYNLTGLEGAEGRRALASNMMQQSAQFLQSKLGRAATFAMAGKNGQLDEQAVASFMRGDGNILGMAHAGVARAGGAAAIMRREGQLRGEVLGKLGMNADVMIMRNILESRGMDVTNADERTKFFMQRRMGVSAEEVDFKIEQMQRLPELMRQQTAAGEQDKRMTQIDRQRGTLGVAGVKKSFEGFKHGVDKALEKTGSDLYQWGSNVLEREVNRLTHDYVQFIEKDVGQAAKDSLDQAVDPFKRKRLRQFGLGGYTRASGSGFEGGTGAINLGGKYKGMIEEDAQAYARRGYEMNEASGFFGGWTRSDSVKAAKLAERAQGLEDSFTKGVSGVKQISKESKEAIKMLMTRGGVDMSGEKMTDTLIEKLKGSASTSELRALAEQASAGGSNLRAATAGSLMRQAGFGETGAGRMATPGGTGLMMNYGGARTETDLFKGIGEYMYKGEDLGKQINAQAKAVDASVALQYRFAAIERNTGLPEGVRSAAKAVREAAKVAQTTTYNQLEATRDKQRKQMAGEGKIDDKQKASFGRELMSEKGGKWSLAIVGSDAAERDAAMGEIEAERLALVNRTEGGYAKMSSDDKGRADMMAYMLAAGDINKMTNGGNTEPTDEQKRRFEAEHQGPDGQPLTFEAAKSKIGVFVDRADVRYRETMQEVWKFNREAGRDWVNKAEKGGTLAGGSLSQIAKERLTAAATGKSLQYIKSLSASGIDVTQGAGAVNKGARFGEAFAEEMTLRGQVREGGSTKENEDLIKRADDLRKEREEISSNWDSATRKRMEGALGATPGFEGAADQLASERKMADRAKKYGVMGGNPNDPANLVKVSRMLGGKLSMEQLKGMEADPEGMAAMLAKSVNVEGMGPEMQGALKKLGSSKLSERNEAIGTLVKAEEEGQRKKSEQAAANDPMVGAIKNAITAAMKTPMAIAPGSTVAITGEVLTREA